MVALSGRPWVLRGRTAKLGRRRGSGGDEEVVEGVEKWRREWRSGGGSGGGSGGVEEGVEGVDKMRRLCCSYLEPRESQLNAKKPALAAM